MKVNNVSLAAIGTKLDQYPKTGLPEVAFVGKSNVGKSSIINGLVGRKSLARVSGNPGKTRTINFYNVEDVLYFVDLPGYGYAKVSKDSRESWGKMIEDYLYNRKTLKLVVLLVDIRHEPSENDKMMADWIIQMGYTPLVVATKADKLSRNGVAKNLAMIRKGLPIHKDHKVVPFSALSKLGKDEIWKIFEEAIQEEVVDDEIMVAPTENTPREAVEQGTTQVSPIEE